MDLFNDEHYAAPTPQQAISRIQVKKDMANTYRPLAYICAVFRECLRKYQECQEVFSLCF